MLKNVLFSMVLAGLCVCSVYNALFFMIDNVKWGFCVLVTYIPHWHLEVPCVTYRGPVDFNKNNE